MQRHEANDYAGCNGEQSKDSCQNTAAHGRGGGGKGRGGGGGAGGIGRRMGTSIAGGGGRLVVGVSAAMVRTVMSSSCPKRWAVSAMALAGRSVSEGQAAKAVELALAGARFGHAVGHQHQALAGGEPAFDQPIGLGLGRQAKRKGRRCLQLLAPPVADEVWCDVPGVRDGVLS